MCVCVHVCVEGGRVHEGGVKRERETERERTKTCVNELMRVRECVYVCVKMRE